MIRLQSRIAETPWIEWDEVVLWIFVVFEFGLGDVWTTYQGISSGSPEINPVALAVLDVGGISAMIGVKVAIITFFLGIYAVTPKPYRVGVPIGLSIVGIAVVVWNYWVLAFFDFFSDIAWQINQFIITIL